MVANTIRAALILFTALTLQLGLMEQLEIRGVSADLMLVCAIAAAVTGGQDRGVAVGFVAGLLYDLFLPSPLAMSALSYGLVAYALGRIEGTFDRVPFWLSMPITALASAAGIGLFVGLGELLAQENFYTPRLWEIVVITSLMNALFAPLFFRVWRWVWSSRPTTMAIPTGVQRVVE